MLFMMLNPLSTADIRTSIRHAQQVHAQGGKSLTRHGQLVTRLGSPIDHVINNRGVTTPPFHPLCCSLDEFQQTAPEQSGVVHTIRRPLSSLVDPSAVLYSTSYRMVDGR
jgi:hypothetical protein